MQKFALLTFNLCWLLTSGWAQNSSTMPNERFIEVTGSAEINLAPDEIDLQVTLKEYGEKNSKQAMTDIEEAFYRILDQNGFSQQNVLLEDGGFYWYYWWQYRNAYHRQKNLTVRIPLDSDTDLLGLIQDMNIDGVSQLRIVRTHNRQAQEMRQTVKMQAIQAAKTKATYLLASIEEQVGHVLSVEEIPPQPVYYRHRNTNAMSNVVLNEGQVEGELLAGLQSIELRYEIKARFAIR